MVKPDAVGVMIRGWRRFNLRADVKCPSWFRVEYRLLEDPDFYDFTHEEFKAWLYIMAQACRKNSDTVTLNYRHAEATAGLSRGGIDGAIDKLCNLQMVTVSGTDTSRERYVSDTRTIRDRQTDRQTEDSSEGSEEPIEAVIEPFSKSQIIVEEFKKRRVSKDSQETWIEQYPDPSWLVRQVLAAIQWERDNPARRKKKFGAFVSRWLARDWDKHTASQAGKGAGLINTTPIKLEGIS